MLERETRKTIPFTIARRKIKYQGTNWTKEVNDLYLENYRTLKKEIKEDTNTWKHIPWIGRINIIKISILPKAIYRFNTLPTKIPRAYFTDLEQILQIFVWNQKRPWIATVILRKKNKVGAIMLPDIKLCCKAIVIKQYGIGIKTNT